MVVVAYERGSFTRESNCSASVGEVLVVFFFFFGGGGRLWDVVTKEKNWSHMEV